MDQGLKIHNASALPYLLREAATDSHCMTVYWMICAPPPFIFRGLSHVCCTSNYFTRERVLAAVYFNTSIGLFSSAAAKHKSKVSTQVNIYLSVSLSYV